MKKVFLILFLLLLGAGGYFAFNFMSKDAEIVDPMTIISADAIYILQADDPIDNWNSFSQSEFWTFLKQHPSFAEITAEADYLDELMSENSQLLKLVGKRDVYMSAHVTKNNDYDFLFLVDLQDASKLEVLPSLLKKITNEQDFKTTEIEYKGNIIIDLYDKASKDHLYIAQIKNFLACTYTQSIMLHSISLSAQDSVAIAPKFTEVENRVDHSGIARLYLNYQYLDDYIKLYANLDRTTLDALESSFSYTGLDMFLDGDEGILEGYTSLPDSVELYTKLLQEHGNAEFGFDEVISARTAYAQAIGIDKFKDFYKKVLELRSKESESMAEYSAMQRKVETVLGLSLEKDILAWVGDEIVLAQSNPSYLQTGEDVMIIAIKAYNIDFAQEKLLKVQKMIKRRTPARFKKMTYKTYDIYYLDIKGFFGLFFGEAFSKITKPYYTIVGDYILFSNSPKTLVANLEDYENGFVLANSDAFNKVKDNLPDEATLLTYINGPLTYPVMRNSVKREDLAEYQKNKPYLNFFKGIGITYTAQGEGFENKIYLTYQEDTAQAIPPQKTDELVSVYLEDHSEALKNLSEAETFVLNEVNEGEFEKLHKGTTQIHIKAETKNGIFHGDFKEFYVDGTLRSEGSYRKGKKVGRWKYYNEQGEITEKSWEGL